MLQNKYRLDLRTAPDNPHYFQAEDHDSALQAVAGILNIPSPITPAAFQSAGGVAIKSLLGASEYHVFPQRR